MGAQGQAGRGRRTLGYLSGRVDARKVYEAWRSRNPAEGFGTMYMLQFLTSARELGHEAVIVTSHGEQSYEADFPELGIVNMPHPDPASVSGWEFHLGEIAWTLKALWRMYRAGARVIVLTDNQLYWFLTLPFRLLGVRFVNALHCTHYLQLGNNRLPRRLFNRLTGWLHYVFADPTIGVSPAIMREVAAFPGAGRRWAQMLTTDYPRAFIDRIAPPAEDAGDRPARVLFAGRAEVNKGVMDLLEICRMLQAREGRAVVFDICGDGTALPTLRDEVSRLGLADVFRVHGLVERDAMARLYGESDIVVVPTRTDFEEGEPRALIEGVLVRRPCVSSRVCPIIEVVADACVEVEPDNPAAYAEAIWQLANDPALAAAKRAAAERLRETFFDPPHSYARSIKAAIARAEER